ncbi:MAG: hypothetical protein U5R14_00810 [Gemmatimonadota bacterium]|nr:hypothetical protein [Gemmatimonadota bacterium]
MHPFSYSTITLAMAGILLGVAGWRWHEAAVVRPDHFPGVDPPAAILVVQERDCPDRRAAMAVWLDDLHASDAGASLPVYLGVLGDDPGLLDPRTDELPRLPSAEASTAARALLRAGLSGTPALIVLDSEGHVLLADTFATTGPGARLALAADLLPAVRPFTGPADVLQPDGG